MVGAHGLRGELRVRVLGDGPENLLGVSHVFLAESERGEDDPAAREYEVVGGGRGRQGEARLSLRGVDERDAAEALRGRWVLVEQAELPALPEGEYYWYELVGCRVESTAGQAIGKVRELWETGAHDVLVVERKDGRRILIPTAAALMREVDLEGRRILVEGLPGLFEPA